MTRTGAMAKFATPPAACSARSALSLSRRAVASSLAIRASVASFGVDSFAT